MRERSKACFAPDSLSQRSGCAAKWA